VAKDRMLTPVYQSIHCLRTGRVIGYEGLVRPKPDSGFPNASALFVAAESTGRTVELDLASLDAVLTGARTLDPSLYLSVNLSPRSLESDIFKPQELLTLARRRDIDPTRILVELTEREAVEDMDRLRSALDLLRSHGVRIAADDVGAGNAGLRLLRELDFDVIKVDLSLVQAGAADNPSGAVLRALRELARQRSQTIVAEGVETPEQLLAVIELEFDAAQGFLLHRPSPTLNAQRLDLARVVFPPEPASVRPMTAVAGHA
jgi:EAL domain-containing protein (putative c-di-GMP-specific phosphodiesterase class I)